MQNFICDGNTHTVTLGSGETTFAAGDIYKVGVMVGVIASLTRNGQTVFKNQASAAGDIAVVRYAGVYELVKATGAVTLGAKLYYDATADNVTTTSSGNTFIGYAYTAQLSGDATVQVLLWKL